MLGSNPNIPSIYPSLLFLIFVSRPLYYSTTTTTTPFPHHSSILRRERFRGNRADVFARARELLEREWATSRRETGKNKGGGKLRKKHGTRVNSGEQGQRKGRSASFNNSNEPITRSRRKSARVDLVRGGLRDVERSVFKPSSAPLSRLYLRLWCTSTFACAYTWLFLYMRRVTLHYVVIMEFEDN